MSQPIPPELLAHWLDHYGQCSRDNGKQNDCYHGKDAAGRDNGCLKVGWKGRSCEHWTSISGNELAWLIAAHTVRDAPIGPMVLELEPQEFDRVVHNLQNPTGPTEGAKRGAALLRDLYGV